MRQYWVYIMTNKPRGTLYTGVTNDLVRRAQEHKRKLVPGFTARYNLGRLVYCEDTADIRAAIAREKKIKVGCALRGFMEISVVSPNLVWISGGGWNDTLNNWQASLVHTTDGGRMFLNDVHKVVTGTNAISEIAFADSVYGWLAVDAGPARTYATSNGGDTWVLQQSTMWTQQPVFLPISQQVVYAGDGSWDPPWGTRISKSTNGGTTWLTLVEGQIPGGAANSFKLSDQHMWILSGNAIWYYQHVEPPSIQPIASDTIEASGVYERQAHAQGLGLRYGLVNSPAWVSIDTLTGLITERPLSQHVGNHAVTVQARDTVAQFATASYELAVTLPLPGAPALVLPLHGAIEQSTQITFLWHRALYATIYHLQVSSDSTFSGDFVTNDSTLTDTTRVLDSLSLASTYYWRVKSANPTGAGDWSEVRWFRTVVTSVAESGDLPSEFHLSQNYPNPFNPSTKVVYRVKSQESIELRVFDVLGREVATLVNSRLEPGTYHIEFDASDLPSGVYLYRLSVGSFTLTRKMLLLR